MHAEFLGDVLAIGGLPVRNVRRAHYVVLDFASDAHDADFGPVCGLALDALKERAKVISKTLQK